MMKLLPTLVMEMLHSQHLQRGYGQYQQTDGTTVSNEIEITIDTTVPRKRTIVTVDTGISNSDGIGQ